MQQKNRRKRSIAHILCASMEKCCNFMQSRTIIQQVRGRRGEKAAHKSIILGSLKKAMCAARYLFTCAKVVLLFYSAISPDSCFRDARL